MTKEEMSELDSEWLRLISRCYLRTQDMKDRMTRIAERIAGLEDLEGLTRVEMKRLEKERGDEKSWDLLDKTPSGG